jgi:hypothetical protein
MALRVIAKLSPAEHDRLLSVVPADVRATAVLPMIFGNDTRALAGKSARELEAA